jgi:hypothetical protein
MPADDHILEITPLPGESQAPQFEVQFRRRARTSAVKFAVPVWQPRGEPIPIKFAAVPHNVGNELLPSDDLKTLRTRADLLRVY